MKLTNQLAGDRRRPTFPRRYRAASGQQ